MLTIAAAVKGENTSHILKKEIQRSHREHKFII